MLLESLTTLSLTVVGSSFGALYGVGGVATCSCEQDTNTSSLELPVATSN